MDLLAHRPGIARLDMSWVGQGSQRLVTHAELKAEQIARVNALPGIHSLRSQWLYNNWMYALAGVIIDRKGTNGSYLNFIEKRVLQHYGLPRSCIQKKNVPDANTTLAYAASQSGKPMQKHEPPWHDSPFTPGGGIRSSATEMLQ